MSDKFFYNKFSTAIIDILELYQIEQSPARLYQNNNLKKELIPVCKDQINFLFPIYVKYIEILRKVEDSYDQTNHPQIRKVMKKFLGNILCRIVQLKLELIYYHYPLGQLFKMHYILFDDFLIDMKLEPDSLNLTIPKYFREETEKTLKRDTLINQRLVEKNGDSLPEQDITKIFYKINLSFDDAIRILQNLEMGRQNLNRVSKTLKLAHKKIDSEAGGEKKILMEDEKKKLVVEHIVSLHKMRKAKEEELKFLKMASEDKFSNDNIGVELAEENRKQRKLVYKEKLGDYEKYKNNMIDNVNLLEKYNIQQGMTKERKEWVEKETHLNKGQPPQSLKAFYEKLNVGTSEKLDDNQKKVADDITKTNIKKEQEKKKKDEGTALVQVKVYSGPTEQVKNLLEATEEFKKKFEIPSEFINKKEEFIADMAREEIIGRVHESIRKEVDALLEMEIKNRRTIYLKGKKDRIPRPDRTKIIPEKFGPGEKNLSKIDINELFSDALNSGTIRKMVPKILEDLICDFNYVANSMQIVDDQLIEIPLFYTKQLIKEFCIYPLGSQIVKSNTKPSISSALFFGPPGTGKTHAALAVAHQTNSIFIDFSWQNLEKFKSGLELNKAIATAFRVAKFNQPAVIYFDCAEQVFVDKRKFKKGAVKNPNAQRLRKSLLAFKNLVTPDMRILFIGCTNKGWHLNMKDMNAMFDRTFYFSLPSFSDRLKFWKNEISNRLGRSYELEYDILAQMSINFSAESIKQCINYTFSPQRLERLKFDSLKTEEFVSALSKTQYFYKDDFPLNRAFLLEASGLKAIQETWQKLRDGENKKSSRK